MSKHYWTLSTKLRNLSTSPLWITLPPSSILNLKYFGLRLTTLSEKVTHVMLCRKLDGVKKKPTMTTVVIHNTLSLVLWYVETNCTNWSKDFGSGQTHYKDQIISVGNTWCKVCRCRILFISIIIQWQKTIDILLWSWFYLSDKTSLMNLEQESFD